MNIGELVASLGVDTSGLDTAEKAVTSFASKVESSIKGSLSSSRGEVQNFANIAEKAIRSATDTMSGSVGDFGKIVGKTFSDSLKLVSNFSSKSSSLIKNFAGTLRDLTSANVFKGLPTALTQNLRDAAPLLSTLTARVAAFGTRAVIAFGGITAAVGTLIGGLALLAAGAVLTVGIKLSNMGMQWNEAIEKTNISLSASLLLTQNIYDLQGKLLSGTEKQEAANFLANSATQEMVKLSQEGVSSVQEIATTYKRIIGPATMMGMKQEEITGFAALWSNALKLSGGEMGRANQQVASLIKGHVTENSILANNLGITKQMADEWKASGDYVQKLRVHLESLSPAIKAMTETPGALTSSIWSETSKAAGVMTSGAYDESKKSLKEILGLVKSIGSAPEWENFRMMVGDIASGMVLLTNKTVTWSLWFLKVAGDAYAALKPVYDIISSIISMTAAAVKWNIDLILSGIEIVKEWAAYFAKGVVWAVTISVSGNTGMPDLVKGARGLAEKRFPAEQVAVPTETIGALTGAPPGFKTKPKGGAAPPGGKKGGGGGGGGGAGGEDQMKRMIAAWEEEIARLTGTGLTQLDRWRDKELLRIDEVAKKGADAEKAKTVMQQLYGAKREKLEIDFNKWYSGATKDTLKSIALDNEEWTRQFGNLKDAEARIIEVTEMRKYEYFVGLQQKRLELAANYNSEMSSLTPFLVEHLLYQEKSLEVQHQQSMLALERQLKEKEITPEIYAQAVAYESIINKAKELNIERKKWETEGLAGGAKIYGIERANEAATRGAQTFIDLMHQAESSIAGGLSTAIMDALQGKEVDLQKFFYSIAEIGIKKGIEGAIAKIFDVVGKGFLGSEKTEDPMVTASKKVATNVGMAGKTFSDTLITSANEFSPVINSAGETFAANVRNSADYLAKKANAIGAGPTGVAGEGAGVGGGYGGYGLSGGKTIYSSTGLPMTSPTPAGTSAGASAGNMTFTGAPVSNMMGSGMGGGSDLLAELSPALKQFAAATPKYATGSFNLDPGVKQLKAAGVSTEQAANLGMMSNIELGVQAGALALGTIGMITGSKELQGAAMVLQLAAVALQVAVLIMKASSFLPFHSGGIIPSFHFGGRIRRAHSGLKFGPREGLFLGLAGERVLSTEQNKEWESMNFGRGSAAGPPVNYAPTYQFSAIDAKGMDAVLRENLPRHEKTVRKMLAEMYRNGMK